MSQLHENWAEMPGGDQGALMTADEPLAGNEGASRVFGANLKEARLARKLTQKQLAAMAGVERVQVTVIEGGGSNPKLETMTRIANALEIPLHELLTPKQQV